MSVENNSTKEPSSASPYTQPHWLVLHHINNLARIGSEISDSNSLSEVTKNSFMETLFSQIQENTEKLESSGDGDGDGDGDGNGDGNGHLFKQITFK